MSNDHLVGSHLSRGVLIQFNKSFVREIVMRALTAMIFCASMALPIAAYAEMSDTEYCNALSASYRSQVPSTATPSVEVPEAMSKCASSPKTSIPVLEKVLKDNKVTLPKRT